jgi:hypothetical protein
MCGMVFYWLPFPVTDNFLMTYSAAKLSKLGAIFTLLKALPFCLMDQSTAFEPSLGRVL